MAQPDHEPVRQGEDASTTEFRPPTSEASPERSVTDRSDRPEVCETLVEKSVQLSALWRAKDGIIGGFIGASATLLVAYFAYAQADHLYRNAAAQAEELSRRSAEVDFVQARVVGCVSLAEHHRAAAINEAARGYREVAVLTLGDGTKETLSGNSQRHAASITMARALLLCLRPENSANLSECVLKIEETHSGVHVFDYIGDDPTIYGRKPLEGEEFPGDRNIAC